MDHRAAAGSSWRFGKDVITEVQRGRMLDVAAGVAFWLLLSLPAALLAVVSFASMLGERITEAMERSVIELVETTFADEADAINARVQGLFDQPRAGLFSVSLAVAIFTLSRGFAGLIRALDTAYGVTEGRSFVRIRALAIVLAIGTLATVAGSTLALVGLGTIGGPDWLASGAALAVLVLWAATIFHVGPHHHTPWRYDVPGAVVAAAGWFAMSLGYGWYVRFAAGGDQVVGTIGAALLGLTWLWLVCVLLLLGAEINAVIARRRGVVQQPMTVTDRVIAGTRRRIAERRRGGFEPKDPESSTADPPT
jgi:membrane protein